MSEKMPRSVGEIEMSVDPHTKRGGPYYDAFASLEVETITASEKPKMHGPKVQP